MEWKQEVRERLPDLKLEPERDAEVIEELARHLEDRHKEMLAGGATPEEANRTALSELSESGSLAGELRCIERPVPQEPAGSDATRRRSNWGSYMMGDLWESAHVVGDSIKPRVEAKP